MPSSSLSYCRAIVMAERRSAWADLLFLGGRGRRRVQIRRQRKRFHPCRRYLMRMLDLVGSPCSISDFFSAKIFLMVLASWIGRTHHRQAGQLSASSTREALGAALTLNTCEPGSLYVLAFLTSKSTSLAMALTLV